MRRSRYTVTLADDTKYVILAYSADGARAYYTSLFGPAVKHVAKGDYRIEEQRASDVCSTGHTLDQAAIKEAIEFLGLQLPVEIKQPSRVGRRRGSHCFDWNVGAQGVHAITIKSYLNPERASKTLWHELAHAAQAERAFAAAGATTPIARHKAWSAVLNRDRGIGYERKGVERDARKHEEYSDALKLAR